MGAGGSEPGPFKKGSFPRHPPTAVERGSGWGIARPRRLLVSYMITAGPFFGGGWPGDPDTPMGTIFFGRKSGVLGSGAGATGRHRGIMVRMFGGSSRSFFITPPVQSAVEKDGYGPTARHASVRLFSRRSRGPCAFPGFYLATSRSGSGGLGGVVVGGWGAIRVVVR